MATYSEIRLKFTNDWDVNGATVVNTLAFRRSLYGVATTNIFSWVTTRSAAYEVTEGTPTANAGERTAINFRAAFLLDYPTGYVVTVQNINEVLIQSETSGEEFISAYGTALQQGLGLDVQVITNVFQKINIRSPYFITVSTTDVTSAVLDLYIYTGTRVATMDSITYSLE